MTDTLLDLLRQWEGGSVLQLDLHDYRPSIAEIARRNQNRRTRDFFFETTGQSTFTPPPTSGSLVGSPTTFQTGTRTTISPRSRQRRPSSQSSFKVLPRRSFSADDAATLYYQDPSSRLKLRTFVATSQTFDEALEFGFPSAPERPPVPEKDMQQGRKSPSQTKSIPLKDHCMIQERFPFLKDDFAGMSEKQGTANARPKTSPNLFRDSCATFFMDDTPSLSLIDSEDQYMSDPLFNPPTPLDSSFPVMRDSPGRSPQRVSFGLSRPQTSRANTYSSFSSHDREMTMRITITRPDLRAPGDVDSLYSPTGRFKTAELPELYVTNEPGCIWDDLPTEEEGSKMKKMWKKLKIR